MAIFAVYEPPFMRSDVLQQVDDFRFVKEGFSVLAFLLPWLYFAIKRLWVPLVGYVAVVAALMALGSLVGFPSVLTNIVSSLVSVLIGLEAKTLHQNWLEARGYRMVRVISARTLGDAEATFFGNWTPERDAERQVGGEARSSAAVGVIGGIEA